MSSKKTALITGGSRGIGKAISHRLARDGYHVVINFLSNVREAEATLNAITAAGGSAELYPFDVTDRSATLDAITDITTKNAVQVCVLCAGIRHDELLMYMSDEQWDSVIDTNLSSFYSVAKPIVRHMLLNRCGRIIVISSTSGETGLAGQVNYAAAKAGLIGAVKALARECAKRNVLVNALTPGFITTDMTEHINEKELIKTIPMNRFGRPEEVAGAVSFLASDDAGYITGQVIGVNGGVYM
jgi:3-oxoacyl-[acyl-carrier protein] reductase